MCRAASVTLALLRLAEMDFLDGIMFDTMRTYQFPDIRFLSTLEYYTETLTVSPFREYGLLAEKSWQEQQLGHSPYGDLSGRY